MADHPTTPDLPRGGTERLLVVEDDPSVAEVARRLLTRAGYTVQVLRDAESAITALEHETFDLLVSDVVMPGMGGRDLAQELRRRRADVRILFISGYLDIDASRLALDRRTRLLHKPFSPEALLDAVQSMLAGGVPA